MGLKPKTLYAERSTTELPRQLSWLAPNLISHSKPDEQANNHTIQCSEVCTLILCKCYMQLLFLLLQPTESELACSVFVDGEKINIKTNFQCTIQRLIPVSFWCGCTYFHFAIPLFIPFCFLHFNPALGNCGAVVKQRQCYSLCEPIILLSRTVLFSRH